MNTDNSQRWFTSVASVPVQRQP